MGCSLKKETQEEQDCLDILESAQELLREEECSFLQRNRNFMNNEIIQENAQNSLVLRLQKREKNLKEKEVRFDEVLLLLSQERSRIKRRQTILTVKEETIKAEQKLLNAKKMEMSKKEKGMKSKEKEIGQKSYRETSL